MRRKSAKSGEHEPNRLRPRMYLTLGQPVHKVLGRVGNASRYVERALLERDQRWRAALEQLVDAGFGRRDLLAASDVVPDDTAPALVLEAMKAGAYRAAEAWKIPAADWRALVRALEQNPYLAVALLELVRETWSGNLDVASAIEAATEAAA